MALAVLVAIAASLLTFLVVSGDDDGETASSSTTATTAGEDEDADPSPSSTEAPTPTVSEEEMAAAVVELQAFVEEQRGLEFKEDVVVEMLDDDAFEDRLIETLDDDLGDLEHQDDLLTALGMVDGDVDLLVASEQLLRQGVLGYYETEQNELVVRGSGLTPYTRQTIVHELVHALDDQYYELHRPQYEELDDETALGFSSVLEGNARRVEDAWVSTLSPEELDDRDREEALYSLQADLSGVPPILISLLSSPYTDGRVLVDELAATGGEQAIDDAIVEPPTTTEQVLVPERFLAGEQRVEIEPPPADGEVIDQGVLGMLMLKLMLEESVLPSEAARAADGWAGDWYVAWDNDDGTTCVRADVRMDDATEADELLEALESYAADHPMVTVAAQGEDTVRIDGCTPPPEGGGGGSRT